MFYQSSIDGGYRLIINIKFMGIFAMTDAVLEFKTAEEAKTFLEKMKTMKDDLGNFDYERLELCGAVISFYLSSGRIQNLRWQCEKTLEEAKKNGVVIFDAGFMEEADGVYYEAEDEDN